LRLKKKKNGILRKRGPIKGHKLERERRQQQTVKHQQEGGEEGRQRAGKYPLKLSGEGGLGRGGPTELGGGGKSKSALREVHRKASPKKRRFLGSMRKRFGCGTLPRYKSRTNIFNHPDGKGEKRMVRTKSI